jgi:tetratricopeptide (TPR) repeat protein
MKTSEKNRNRWLYVALILMLLALIAFSMVPLINGIVQANQSTTRATTVVSTEINPDPKARLEAEALGYQLVLERDPTSQTALRGLLEVRLKQGNLQDAIEPLEKLAQLNIKEPDYTILLAQAKQQLKDYEGAQNAYRTLLASHPGEIRAVKGMVDLFVAQNRSADAIGFVQDILKDSALNTTQGVDKTAIALLLGQIYVEQKNYGDAIAIYDQAFSFNQKDFRPVLAKALILQEQGKEEQAKPSFDLAISLAPREYKEQIKAIAAQKSQADNFLKK